MTRRQYIPARLDQYVNHDPRLIFKALLVFKARLLFEEIRYIATGLALYKNILLAAIHKASPVYSQMRYIGTWLVYTVSHSTDGAILLSKLLVQSN